MINLDFKYIAAKNFICFGPDGIEIDLKKYGNIVLIDGKNYDDVNDEGRPGSNGSGKSTFADIITYTLFGRPVKRPKKLTHKDVINNKVNKGLRTEVVFDNYRVVRYRKPDKLELFEEIKGEWVMKELGGMPATQKEIERIIGLTYETFINVMFFDDSNASSFLESDTPTKRKIVENLLSLERYRSFGKKASELMKDANNKIKFMATEFDHLLMEAKTYERRVTDVEEQEKNWKAKKTEEVSKLESSLVALTQELKSTDSGNALYEYEQAQDRISMLSLELPVLEGKQTELTGLIDTARGKRNEVSQKHNDEKIKAQEIKSQFDASMRVIKEHQSALKDLTNLDVGSNCKVCYSLIDSKSYAKVEIHYKGIIASETTKIEKNKTGLMEQKLILEKTKIGIEKLDKVINKGEEGLSGVSQKIKLHRGEIVIKSKLEKPESGIKEKVLEERITEVRKQITNRKEEVDGPSPYVEIVKSAIKEHKEKEKECNKKKREVEKAKTEVPYYKFWVDAFGDNGIRKFIIEGIIPALNSRVSYWLQFLIDNKISMVFNNQLEETIERNPVNGDPFIYYAMSGGERRRLNLAVSQAFAHIMMLSSGSCPSLVFLDEVTSNIDSNGVEGIHNMIFELSKDRQIFVTTHDQNLLDMLTGCEVITFHKRDGFTTIAA
jgi:DNA repair exonuclease SbcCD ATPase subunit